MTVKDASEIFHIEERKIRKRNKDGMIIGTSKINNRIYIPEDTTIIPSKKIFNKFYTRY